MTISCKFDDRIVSDTKNGVLTTQPPLGGHLRFLFFLLLSLFLGVTSVSSWGEVDTPKPGSKSSREIIKMELLQEGKFPVPEVIAASDELTAEAVNGFKEYLHKAFLKFEKQISVAQYGLSKENARRLTQDLINDNPELFIVSGECPVEVSDGVVLSMEPIYAASSDELKQYYAEVQRIAGLANRSWSDLEKLLFIHDYMDANYEYDLTYSRYTAQELLLEGKGVCSAYQSAYIAIMRELGVVVEAANDFVMNHGWNVVLLNEKWYHVDVTWDDPLMIDWEDNIYDVLGRVSHNHFLLSDSAILEKHGNENTGTSRICSDTQYDHYYWQEIEAPFVWNAESWYVLCGQGIHLCNPATGVGESVLDIKNAWLYLSSFGTFENKLYYLSESGINTYDVVTKESSLAYKNPKTPYSHFAMDGLCLKFCLESGSTGKLVLKKNDIFVKEFNDFEYVISPYRNGSILLDYLGTDKNVVIPKSVRGYKVLEIVGLFESNEEIEKVEIPAGVVDIGDNTFAAVYDEEEYFYNSSLQSVKFENGSQLKNIGDYAFAGCVNLSDFEIPLGVTTIGDYAFHACIGLDSMDIPEGIDRIGLGTFNYCYGLTSVVIPQNVGFVGDLAFGSCLNLSEVLFTGDQPAVEEDAFYDTPLLFYIYFLEGKAGWEDGGTWCGKTTVAYTEKPRIKTQPRSLVTEKGFPATFRVSAFGAETYQWYKDGEKIEGATGASYTIAGVSESDEGSYTVVVSNKYGLETPHSVFLSVFSRPEIHAKLVDGKLILTFTGTLETSNDRIHWTSLDVASPCTVEMTGAGKFFRAVK